MTANNINMLIVDDEPTSVQVIWALLEEHVNLHLAESGKQAVEIMEQQSIDMILMDIDLPDISGFELTSKIKTLDSYHSQAIIFISGYQDLIFEVQAFRAGALDYLVKPISPERLLLRVNAHLNLDLPIPGF